MEGLLSEPAPVVRKDEWAPGIVPMTVYSVLTVLALGGPNLVSWTAVEIPGSLGVFFGLAWIVFAFLAHRQYKRAEAALAADEGLRGRWLKDNLWWVLLLALVVPFVLALGVASLQLLRES